MKTLGDSLTPNSVEIVIEILLTLTECPRKRQKVSEMENHGF